jgi:hypothetical protein
MKLLGHPVHQILIVFPVGLLVTAFLFDCIGFASGNPEWWRGAYWMIPAGIIGGLTAAVFGFLDWRGIPAGTRASRVGLWHGLGNVIVGGPVCARLVGARAAAAIAGEHGDYAVAARDRPADGNRLAWWRACGAPWGRGR